MEATYTSFIVILGISCLFIALMVFLGYWVVPERYHDDWDTMESGSSPQEDLEKVKDCKNDMNRFRDSHSIAIPSPAVYKTSATL